ncbi:MAG: 30S ribosomal protein S17 [Candidatus Aenigmatarchaeota archaeon]
MKKDAEKDIGIGVAAPAGSCEDQNCPWHGSLPVRGRIFEGNVVSAKSHLTVVVERKYPYFIPKYQSYERRKSRITAHNPTCIAAKEGDAVTVAECRPLSKTKAFVVVAKETVKGK